MNKNEPPSSSSSWREKMLAMIPPNWKVLTIEKGATAYQLEAFCEGDKSGSIPERLNFYAYLTYGGEGTEMSCRLTVRFNREGTGRDNKYHTLYEVEESIKTPLEFCDLFCKCIEVTASQLIAHLNGTGEENPYWRMEDS